MIYVMPDAQAERKSGKDITWTLLMNPEYDLKNFYYFWVVGSRERDYPRSNTVGYFAVNKKTGDVWEVVNMEHITSPQLAGVQKIIRKHHDISEAVLKKDASLRPTI